MTNETEGRREKVTNAVEQLEQRYATVATEHPRLSFVAVTLLAIVTFVTVSGGV